MLLRMYRSIEERPLEVVWIYLEEFDKLIKLDQLAGNGFYRSNIFLIEDQIIVLFQLVTVGNIALGNLVTLLAEKLVGDRVLHFSSSIRKLICLSNVMG